MPRIKHLIEYIDVHYNEDWSLDELADMVGLNSQYLSRGLFFLIGGQLAVFIGSKDLGAVRRLYDEFRFAILVKVIEQELAVMGAAVLSLATSVRSKSDLRAASSW